MGAVGRRPTPSAAIGGISPLHPPFRQPLLALSGKVRIKPSLFDI